MHCSAIPIISYNISQTITIKMKIILFVAFVAFIVNATEINLNKIGERMDLTSKIKAKLNALKANLNDPIVLEDKRIQINNENTQLDATLTGSISGIFGLDVNKFDINFFPGINIKNFEFVLPELQVDITSYDLDGQLGLFHLFGKGKIFLNLKDVVLKGNGKIGSKFVDDEQYIYIISLTVDLNMDTDAFNFQITGWLNDEIRSAWLTKMINSLIHDVMVANKPQFDQMLSELLSKIAAGISIPLKDLFG